MTRAVGKSEMTGAIIAGWCVIPVVIRFHLQGSGIGYEASNYWDIDLESIVFECESCRDLFSE